MNTNNSCNSNNFETNYYQGFINSAMIEMTKANANNHTGGQPQQQHQHHPEVQVTNASNIQNMPSTIMSSKNINRLDLLIASFSCLLSSAHTNGKHQAMDSGNSLRTLLSRFSSGIADGASLSIPSLKVRRDRHQQQPQQKDPTQLMEGMALSLASPLSAHRGNIDAAPEVLLHNTANSFKELISSRLRVSIQAITARFLKMNMDVTGDARILRRLLTTTNSIKITTVVTSFQVIDRKGRSPPAAGDPLVKPLVFETIVDLTILGKMYTITLQAPGTISASLHQADDLLDGVSIVIDTMALLKTMMMEARLLVKKAIDRAASITSTVTTHNRKNKCVDHHDNDTSKSYSNQLQQQEQQEQQKDPQFVQQNELLASYPEHLRETVQHFLPPPQEPDAAFNVEGFPPNLLNTLKSLAGDTTIFDSNNNQFGDNNDQQDHNGVVNQQAQHLHQGLFSWMHNDEMMLPQKQMHQQTYNYEDESNYNSIHYPLTKRNKKVSFQL